MIDILVFKAYKQFAHILCVYSLYSSMLVCSIENEIKTFFQRKSKRKLRYFFFAAKKKSKNEGMN